MKQSFHEKSRTTVYIAKIPSNVIKAVYIYCKRAEKLRVTTRERERDKVALEAKSVVPLTSGSIINEKTYEGVIYTYIHSTRNLIFSSARFSLSLTLLKMNARSCSFFMNSPFFYFYFSCVSIHRDVIWGSITCIDTQRLIYRRVFIADDRKREKKTLHRSFYVRNDKSVRVILREAVRIYPIFVYGNYFRASLYAHFWRITFAWLWFLRMYRRAISFL